MDSEIFNAYSEEPFWLFRRQKVRQLVIHIHNLQVGLLVVMGVVVTVAIKMVICTTTVSVR